MPFRKRFLKMEKVIPGLTPLRSLFNRLKVVTLLAERHHNFGTGLFVFANSPTRYSQGIKASATFFILGKNRFKTVTDTVPGPHSQSSKLSFGNRKTDSLQSSILFLSNLADHFFKDL